MLDVAINYWAVLVAGVVAMVVGAFWYSNAMFAKPWMKEIGKKESELGGANSGYVIAIVSNLVMAYVLAHFIQYAGATTIWQGVMTGAWAWLGFAAATSAMNYAFSGKSWKLFAIDSGMQLVVLVIMGAILATWR